MRSAGENVKRIGFIINPIAGMGGRVGLKGTDGVAPEACRLGAKPVAPERAEQTLAELVRLLQEVAKDTRIQWLTCSGVMGEDALRKAGFTMSDLEIKHEASSPPNAGDTQQAAARLVESEVDLILFCGGDGTARDICSVVGDRVPILGIPSGVKMYSGVFGTTPARTANIVLEFLQDRLTTAQVDVLDIDETQYRADSWHVTLYHTARTPYEPTYTQSSKALIDSAGDEEVKAAIAEALQEQFEAQPDMLVLLGPGSSVRSVAERLGIRKTLLGIDATANGELIGSDLNERELLDLIVKYPKRCVVLSPIGAQGFVLGRGNLQLSPDVVRAVGTDNIILIATPAKLARTPLLRFDTGDPSLDRTLVGNGFVRVLTGYRRRRLVRALT